MAAIAAGAPDLLPLKVLEVLDQLADGAPAEGPGACRASRRMSVVKWRRFAGDAILLQGWAGAYSIGVDSDCAATTATLCTGAVGREDSGRFDQPWDADLYRVQLVAGHSYQLGYMQLDCAGRLRILDKDGRVVADGRAVASGPDDPAVPDPVQIRAAYTGTYYLDLSWDTQLDDEHGCPAAYGYLLRELP